MTTCTAAVGLLCTILAFSLPSKGKVLIISYMYLVLSPLTDTHLHSGQQCPVSVPTISTSNDDLCQVVFQGLLSYTCTNDIGALAWSSDLFSSSINVQAGSPVNLPSVTVNGVTLMVTENNNTTCFNSTLTFTGNLSSLTALDDRTLSCFFSGDPTDTITISVPSEYQARRQGGSVGSDEPPRLPNGPLEVFRKLLYWSLLPPVSVQIYFPAYFSAKTSAVNTYYSRHITQTT